MKLKISLFFVWTLILSNLFYQEYWGLNALLVAFSSVLLIGITQTETIQSPKWWFVSSCLLISGAAVFINGTVLQGLLYVATFLFFFAVSNRQQLSLFTGGLQSTFSLFTGIYRSFHDLLQSLQNLGDRRAKKIVVNLIITFVSFITVIIFLKLYQTADMTFREWTAFINLDWISWGFLFFYFFMLIFLYGLFFYQQEESINQLEDDRKNSISIGYTDRIQRFLGQRSELKAALVLLSLLNLLLLLYNIIDIRYVLFVMDSGARGTTDSIMVHEGIRSLIGSIVLVVLLVSFFFRGPLNFTQNKGIRLLAFFWLAQNISMICTSSIKNMEYISHYGLTYKRVGVIIYLSFALIGIGLTLYKLWKKKSIWFLVRSTSLSFLLAGSILLSINWNRTIAWYNVNFITAVEIDFPYLMELGPDAYPYILDYHSEKGIEDSAIISELAQLVPNEINRLEHRKRNYSWRSMNWSDEWLLRQLKRHKFVYHTKTNEHEESEQLAMENH